MDGETEYQYGDPALAHTWVPAYPGLSRQFIEDYYGERVARSISPPQRVPTVELSDDLAVQPDLEDGQHEGEGMVAARGPPPSGAASIRIGRAPVIRQPLGRERTTNFPVQREDGDVPLASHAKYSSASQLPRSQGSMDLRNLVIERPTAPPVLRRVDPYVPEYRNGEAGLEDENERVPETSAKRAQSRRPSSDDEDEEFPTPRPQATPDRKRKGRDDSEATEQKPKRAKASKVVTNVFSSVPAHAPQASVSQLNGASAPPSVAPGQLLQGGKGRAETATDGYGELLRGRIPVNTQMPLSTVITVEELATFHPHSFQIPEVVKRMIRNKIPSGEIATMQLEATGELNEDNHLTLDNRLKYQYSKGGQLACHDKFANGQKFDKKLIEADGVQTDLTADQWRFRSEYKSRRNQEAFGHVMLADIYEPVSAGNRPTGKGRGKLTQYLEFAERYDSAHPGAKLDTSHWDWIATQANAQNSQLSAGFATLDHEVMDGLRAVWRT